MWCKRIVFGALLCAVIASLALGQDSPRPGRASTDSKELKRTARRMRMSEQQLKNLREILTEATDLALRLDPPPNNLSMLGGQWMQIDRGRAPDTFERIMANLKDRAFRASDAESYSRISQAARGILSALLQLDADRAQQIGNQWPLPAAPLGERAVKEREQFQQMFQRNYAMAIASRDPEKALPLLRAAGNQEAEYGARGMAAGTLIRSGQRDEGLRLIDETISDFSQNSSSKDLQNYLNFVQQLVYTAPERLQQAMAPVSRLINAPGPSVDTGAPIIIGDQTVMLTSTEHRILNLFRGLSMRPELLLRTLNSLPELKVKVDRYGGIDAFLNPATRGMPLAMPGSIPPPGFVMESRAGGPGIYYPSHPAMTRETGERTFRELKGRAAREPAVVRQRLQKDFSKPEQIQSLIGIASMSSYEDPELGTLCLEQARSLLSQVQPLQARAGALQQLISAYRNVEGEADIGLIRDGFLLADQMREESKQKGLSSPAGHPADHLEATLTAEYARVDFDAAMRFIRALPDDPAKLAMYNQLLQTLRMPY